MICTICGGPIDPAGEEPHWTHDRSCPGGICTCDLPVHPACCTDPACRPQEIEGQLSITDELEAVV